MSLRISQRKAEQTLEKAVKDFDWIGEFLGAGKEEFLQKYMALHAQLRKGDELIIKIRKSQTYLFHEPDFRIILISGENEVMVYSMSPDGSTVEYLDNLLYHNK